MDTFFRRYDGVQLIYRLIVIEKITFSILTCSIDDVTKNKIHLFNYNNANGEYNNVVSNFLPINV